MMNDKILKILVVEDAAIAAKMAVMVLEAKGCKVDIAVTGQEALEKSKNYYDLILLDIGLPDIEGYEVAKEIRGRQDKTSQVPIVALTAHDDPDTQEKWKEAGIDSGIAKPFTIAKCEKLLRTYLKSR